jgi:hypothetical protein
MYPPSPLLGLLRNSSHSGREQGFPRSVGAKPLALEPPVCGVGPVRKEHLGCGCSLSARLLPKRVWLVRVQRRAL